MFFGTLCHLTYFLYFFFTCVKTYGHGNWEFTVSILQNKGISSFGRKFWKNGQIFCTVIIRVQRIQGRLWSIACLNSYITLIEVFSKAHSAHVWLVNSKYKEHVEITTFSIFLKVILKKQKHNAFFTNLIFKISNPIDRNT